MIYWVLTILTAAFAYAMGNLNSSIVASNLIFHADLRKLGTGSAALSNFRRIYGIKGAIKLLLVELVIDLLPILIAGWLFGIKDHAVVGRAFAGFCLVMGSVYPALYELHGGHGILALIVAACCVYFSMGFTILVLVLALIWFTRYMSLTVLAGAATMIAGALLLIDDRLAMFLCIFTGIAVIVKHIPAISRLSAGKETKISFKEDINYKFDEKF